MLSEIAINDPKMFSEFVRIAKEGKAGKITKATEVSGCEVTIGASKADKKETVKKETVKKETKKEETTEKVDYSKMTVAELKEAAKKAGIKGATTMKKAELIEALNK